MAEAGVICGSAIANEVVTRYAAQNQPLLERMSTVAQQIGRSKWRQLMRMPLLLVLQLRLLWQSWVYSRCR